MDVFPKNCRLLCFSGEEEFSALPFKNKVADEKISLEVTLMSHDGRWR
jgi:hypothetical protein